MKAKLFEHALSVCVVTCVFLALAMMTERTEASRAAARTKAIEPYLGLVFLDLDNPSHRALLKETLDIFYPDSAAGNDSVMKTIESFQQERFTNREYKTGGDDRGLSFSNIGRLGNMYLQFILMYLIVMTLSYHAAQSLAVLRYVRMKQHRSSYLTEVMEQLQHTASGKRTSAFYLNIVVLSAKALCKGMVYAVFFAPAYVIGYSVKSTFDTGSFIFMIVLGIISNGLLVNYANKFYTFLVAESRKGYVQTAIVKNLDDSYAWEAQDGIPFRAVLYPKSIVGGLSSHVFKHIYLNARYQYVSSLKEFASFLITGLIIIEMALNIQGHLGYELLQTILYRDYAAAMAIVVAIFLVVKGTEVVVDVWMHVETRKYENKTAD